MNVNAIVQFLEREDNKFYHVMINNDWDRLQTKHQIEILCGYYGITPTRDALALRLVYNITSNIISPIGSLPCHCNYTIKFNQLGDVGTLHISCDAFMKRLNERIHDVFKKKETVYILMTRKKTINFLETVPFRMQANGWKVNDKFIETWSEMITKIH